MHVADGEGNDESKRFQWIRRDSCSSRGEAGGSGIPRTRLPQTLHDVFVESTSTTYQEES
jgi:hypothetical protein